jgi:hypothetical protein
LSSTGSALNWVDNTASASVVYQDGFTGNGSTTAFTLANSIDNENKTQVYIDGVYQHKDTYSLNGTTLTFSTAPPNTSDIEVISFKTVTADGDILTDSEFSSAGLMKTNGSGVYSIITDNSTNWNTAYTYSQVGHLPLAGGTVTGDLIVGGTNKARFKSDGTNTYVDAMPASSSIIFRNSGSIEKMRLNSSGNLGIGTEQTSFNGNSKLQIARGNSPSYIQFISGNLQEQGILFGDPEDTVEGSIRYAHDGDYMWFQVSNTERMRINSSGNVGIGTTSPAEKLEVSGSVKIGNLKIQNANSGRIGFNRNTATGAIYDSNSSAIQINGPSSSLNYLSIEAYNSSGNFTNQMVYTGSGNLGIGTTSPDALLDLESATPALRITDTDNNKPYELRVDAETFSIKEVSNSRTLMSMTTGAVITLDSLGSNTVINTSGAMVVPNGKVGIGTTSPASKLEVYGNVQNDTTSVANSAAYIRGADVGIAIGQSASSPYGTWIQSQRNSDGVNFPLSLNPSGSNVGIGTTSPAAPLDVNGATYVRNVIYGYAGGGNQYGGLSWGGTDEGFLFLKDSNVTKVNINSNGNSYFNGGNVGIGTTSPLEKLNIVETTTTAGTFFPVAISGARYQADYGVGVAFRPENNSSAYANKTAIVGSGGGYGYNMADLHFCFNNSTTITDEVSLSDAKVTMKRSGNVGIGTTAPTYKLQVNGTGYINETLYVNGATTVDDNLYVTAGNVGIGTTSPDFTGFGWNVLTVQGGTGAGNAGVLELAAPSTDANGQNLGIVSFNSGNTRNAQIAANRDSANNDGRLSFWTSAGSGGIEERMRITSAGNVGIGTTSPLTTLDLGINAGQKFYVYANGTIRSGMGIDLSGSQRELSIFHTSSNNIDGDISLGLRNETSGQYIERMRIQGNGNVGIGTTSPNAKLEVRGTVKINSDSDSDILNNEQTLTVQKALSSAGTAVPIAFVDHTHALQVTVIIKQNTSNVASGVGRSVVAYGAASTGMTSVQGSGNVTGITLAYLNTNPSGQDYVLTLTWSGSGASPVAHVTIRGNSAGTLAEY